MRAISGLVALTLTFTFPAFAGPLHDAARMGDTAAMTELLDGGAGINEVAVMTPLQMAALNGQLGAVEVLIERGADLNATTSIIGAALHAAAQRGHADIVAALLNAGANPDARNNDEFTPIMVASQHGQLEAVGVLINGGANVNAIGIGRSRTTGGQGKAGALHLAAYLGHWDVFDLLQEAGAKPKIHAHIAEILETADSAQGRELALKFCANCHMVEADQSALLVTDVRGASLIGVFVGRSAR